MDGNRRRIALFGGSFNPPGEHHTEVVRRLVGRFDEVIVAPCGPRPDKPVTNTVSPADRARMARLAFGSIPGVTLMLEDLERANFTSNHEFDSILGERGEVWHVVGSDLVRRTRSGLSVIQSDWERGDELWREGRFAVVLRTGYEIRRDELPPHHEIIEVPVSGSSSEIRGRLARGESAAGLVSPAVEAWIRARGLYGHENAGREACSRPAAG